MLWRVGWLTWHAAALTLLALFVVLALRARPTAPVLSTLALVCAGAGLAADLSAEALLMGGAPSVGDAGFVAAERASLLFTGYVGNGLYSVAGALLTVSLYARWPRSLAAVAVVVWTVGVVLSAGTLADSTAVEIGATAILMPAFVVFAAMTARWLRGS